MTAVLEARPVGGALADDASSGSVRLVRVEAFEPAVYVAPSIATPTSDASSRCWWTRPPAAEAV